TTGTRAGKRSDSWATVGITAVLAVAQLAAGAGPTHAAFPGRPGLIAFTSVDATDAAGTNVYVAALDGSGLRCATNTQGNEQFPAWAPDGRWIAYWNTDGGIRVVAATGGPERRV